MTYCCYSFITVTVLLLLLSYNYYHVIFIVLFSLLMLFYYSYNVIILIIVILFYSFCFCIYTYIVITLLFSVSCYCSIAIIVIVSLLLSFEHYCHSLIITVIPVMIILTSNVIIFFYYHIQQYVWWLISISVYLCCHTTSHIDVYIISDDNTYYQDGDTALHQAVKTGDIEVLRLLLDRDANIEAVGNVSQNVSIASTIHSIIEYSTYVLAMLTFWLTLLTASMLAWRSSSSLTTPIWQLKVDRKSVV